MAMRLGLIGDIHGDIRALEATLRHLEALGVGDLVCTGDLVGYGAYPDAVVEVVRDRGIPCVRGNHDRWAVERRRLIGPRGWKPAVLKDETWAYLEAMPTGLTLECAGRTLAVHHGSPASDTEFVSPYKPLPDCIVRFWEATRASLLVLGHTHLPMIEHGGSGRTILNPGSVHGVSGIQTSYSFAVLDLEPAVLAVRIYDIRLGRIVRRDPVTLPDDF